MHERVLERISGGRAHRDDEPAARSEHNADGSPFGLERQDERPAFFIALGLRPDHERSGRDAHDARPSGVVGLPMTRRRMRGMRQESGLHLVHVYDPIRDRRRFLADDFDIEDGRGPQRDADARIGFPDHFELRRVLIVLDANLRRV
ncbi:MAG TPA: hypothetical protein VFT32_07645, partial [Candidatus Eisenbacteria bacterium]|nr:hypothetical protein [Candidatus Eisenbacteria bacterium]